MKHKQNFWLILVICTSALSAEGQFYSCPEVAPDTAGICSEACSDDSDCPGEASKCCSNGCGHVCTAGSTIPYHAPPLTCPEVEADTAGMCSEECSDADGCSNEGELCCSNGCGHVCTPGVSPAPLCTAVRDGVTNSSLIGAYVPQCDENGSFSAIQCHGSTGYCWCVAVETGEPVTDIIRFQMPECNCTYEGRAFSAGESFQSLQEDNCDICSCTVDGGVRCISNACDGDGDSNSDDSNTGPNEGAFYSCPAVRAGASTDCDADCLLHSECDDPLASKCCYNGCGYSCTQPHRIPYINISSAHMTECPDASDVPCLDTTGGSCREESFACDNGEEICCDNLCGSAVCVSTELDSPCFIAVEIALASNTSELLGSYRPQCTSRGLFREIQCHAHFCWCVVSNSGVPISDVVPFEQANVLACAECVYNGVKYNHLESFPSGSDCNTCTCIGGTISCSFVGCDDDDDEEEDEWEWWHSVLIGCVTVVVVLVSVVLALLVGIVILMRQNSPHRHQRLKEANNEECEMVEYRNGLESVELKVPVEDNAALVKNDVEPVNA